MWSFAKNNGTEYIIFYLLYFTYYVYTYISDTYFHTVLKIYMHRIFVRPCSSRRGIERIIGHQSCKKDRKRSNESWRWLPPSSRDPIGCTQCRANFSLARHIRTGVMPAGHNRWTPGSGQSHGLYMLARFGTPPINYSPRTKQGGTNAVHDAVFEVT